MEIDSIEIFGVKEYNLKDFDVMIFKNKLVVFVGVLGLGKFFFVFDMLVRESSRQWQDSYFFFLWNKLFYYECFYVDEIKNLFLFIVVNQKVLRINICLIVGMVMDIVLFICLLFLWVG